MNQQCFLITFVILYFCDNLLQISQGFRRPLFRSTRFSVLKFVDLKYEKWVNAFEDDEEYLTFFRITKDYLANKFQTPCTIDDEDCVFARAIQDTKLVLEDVLPPVTPQELDIEVQRIFSGINSKSPSTSKMEETTVEAKEFVEAVLQNPYWIEAGPRVVLELIYLDCVYHFHYKKVSLLQNDEYDELKNWLQWDGSIVSSVKAKEALFISAVAAFRRNKQLLSDAEYESLKNELQQEESWIVQRLPDPFEKLGLNTFMGYLHRSLRLSK
jgi:hypothetical protein